MRKYEVLGVERVFQEFFAVDRATVQWEKLDGSMSEPVGRLSLERGDAVGLIVYDQDLDRLLFVRQFRYPTVAHGDPWPLECAAGMIDKGEAPEAAARRELEEELGYGTADLTHLCDFYSSPGGMSEQITMYFARVGTRDRTGKGGGLEQEQEEVERVELSRDQVDFMLENNQFHDSKTLIGLLQAKSRELI